MLKKDVESKLKELGNKVIMIVTTDSVYYAMPGYVSVGETTISFDWCEVLISSITYLGSYKKLDTIWPTWGSDPEFFFKKDGKVIPSSRVIPPTSSNVVRDGFQAELNPETNTCRQVSGNKIYDALDEAQEYADRARVEMSLTVGEEVDKETFYGIPAADRRFGCSPTSNVHENTKRVAGTRTQFRSGGGHVHMGSGKLTRMYENDATTLISLMDIVCGVGCVLIDRDPANIERRKHYGRAGEHRKKPYGLEYRVPSNFWLQHYTLWSMVTVMLRNAMNLAADAKLSEELLSKINIQDVRNAINNNDKELAMKIYKQYAGFIKDNKITFQGGFGLELVDKFLEWASNDNPISMLPNIGNPMDVWETHAEYEEVPGIERFLNDDY